MSSSQLYEDQENRVPAQRNKREDPRTTTSVSIIGNNNNRRPVLGAISNNIRKQPTRAAKQGVSYETGVPQQCNDVSSCSSSSSTSFGSSNQLTFTIHQDPEKCLPQGCSSTSAPARPLRERRGRPANTENEEPTLDPTVIALHRSSDIEPCNSSRSGSSEGGGSNEVMEMSVCEEDLMVVEAPCSVTTSREDLLHSRSNDVFDVPEYAEDIYQYLREAEVCHKPRANYMSKQTDITASMRWILVDWLVEVAEEYTLHTETLYLTVSYIDRFLSHMSVKRDKLQLVGTTAMFIAAKYEEIYPPDVGQFAYITDNTYKVGQILRMEHLILKVLSFDMAVPTAHLFVNKFARINKAPEETLHLALFLAELTMLDCDPFLRYLPSVIAASAVALANHTQGRVVWPEEMVAGTGYTLEDLRECYVNLYRAFTRVHEPQQHAIRDKYRSSKWHGVSQLSPRQNFPW
ncbi:hypothetical protein Pcinc_025164 [Petrolisthes cinctipes]|uniref:Cyclin A n=1 Tax=Petrolisthes cinctipes TaxID=88211 RepID=A0AAE1F9P7_PETCI|nr:hypothetical protein Pcinc_025164 [Petrolisthes cinctipes]